MFNKLLSNLPFNPSLINQVSFYGQRLKKETSVRRMGFLLVSLTLFLQLFAVFSPAQPTLARAGNDLIPGGVTSKAELIDHCNHDDFQYATILKHFAITCANLANNSAVVTLHSNDFGNTLYSMGRQPQGPVNLSTHRTTNEVTVNVSGIQQPFYMRLLSSWDARVPSTYTALSVGNGFDVQSFILFSCGNIVQKGKPTPPPTLVAKPVPPPPAPKPKPLPKPVPVPVDVCPLVPGLQTDKSQCKPCSKSKNDNDVADCLVPSKKAKNVTQNISNANNTTANAGDSIVYTLQLQNIAKISAKTTVFESMGDVLEYADITNLHGATLTSAKVVIWPEETIPAGGVTTHEINVKVKDPVPQTPSPCPPGSLASPCPNSGSFDMIMTNVYGNTINIKLPPTIIKTTEIVTTTSLPNTGPGTGLIVSFVMTSIVGYFLARSRLMAKELAIVRHDYSTSGGM